MRKRLHLCYVVSSEMTVLAFLKSHIIRANLLGYDVSVVLNTSNMNFLLESGLPGSLHSVPISRKINFWKDIIALSSLYCLFRSQNFDIVHSVTPKAGLLAMLAAYAAATPCRLHTFTGQVWVTKSGGTRWLLRMFDKFLGKFATRVLADSHSQMKFLIEQGVVSSEKIEVIGNGSISGVDCRLFQPDSMARTCIRNELNIPLDAVVLLYLGRLNREKGVMDLADAFIALADKHRDSYLLIVGPDEGGITAELKQLLIGVDSRVCFVGFTLVPHKYLASADICCLPSHREGFGSAVIEAAAAGIPCVASRIYGLTDAVVDGLTGLLHRAGDSEELSKHLSLLLSEPVLRLRMGSQARRHVLNKFTQEGVSKALFTFYERVFQ